MRNIKKKIKIIFILGLIGFSPYLVFPQTTGPGGPNGGGPTGPPVGGGAPIGSGLIVLLSLGAAYGGKKVYNLNKKKLDE